MSKEKLFSAPGHITGIKSVAHHWKITVDTQDGLSGDAIGMLADMRDSYGYFVFKTSPITPEDLDLPELKMTEKGDKTPSQRLRAVMFRMWEQGGKEEFKTADDHYKYTMETLIDYCKKKLE